MSKRAVYAVIPAALSLVVGLSACGGSSNPDPNVPLVRSIARLVGCVNPTPGGVAGSEFSVLCANGYQVAAYSTTPPAHPGDVVTGQLEIACPSVESCNAAADATGGTVQ